MIHGITGLMNSGKTFYMSLMGLFQYYKGKTIISNYDLAYPHYKVNRDFIFKLGKEQPILTDVCFLLDELWIWLDCRSSMANTISTYFFLQSSKDDTKIYFTSQNIGQVERRLRDNLHAISNCQRVLKQDGKFVNISEDDRFLTEENGYDASVFDNLYIKVQTFKQINFYIYTDFVPKKREYIRVKPFIKLFNTSQKIKYVSR